MLRLLALFASTIVSIGGLACQHFVGKPVTVAEDKQLQVGDTLRDFNDSNR